VSELTLDALAAATRVPSRTIRFYQSKGLLPRPQLQGRVAVYGQGHVERLELIASLQDRGLQIKAIAALLGRVDAGEVAVADWLGLDAQLQEAWADEAPRVVEPDALQALVGPRTPGRLAQLLRLGLLEKRGPAYLVPAPTLLQLALRLEALGVELETVVEAARLLRKRLGKAAAELAEHFLPGKAKGGLPPTARMREVRPVALEAVRLLFAQEMERVLREWSESGKAAKLAARAARASRGAKP
jgi:DNA-binding transcriptional MerR regulator